MDDRPIDPFGPDSRRDDPPPSWPPVRPESDTQELPVVSPPVAATPPRRRGMFIALASGAAVVLAIVAATVVFVGPEATNASPDRAAAGSDKTPAADSGSSTFAGKSPTPSNEPEPDTEPSSDAKPPADDGTEPDDAVTVPSRPTKFGAWFAGTGTYDAKWRAPANDGGADIVSYVVGDCQGNNLTIVDSNTFEVSVAKDHLECMSVYAVNSAGLGTDAQHRIANNP